MSTKLNVSVVIPNYNGEKLLTRHLPSIIKASTNPQNRIKEILIVDDASTDNSVQILNDRFPEVIIIQQNKNVRFPANVNTGIKHAKEEIVCLLNNDVSVSENFLVKVLEHFSDNMLFGISLNEQGFAWTKGIFRDGYVVYEEGKEKKFTHDTFWVSGGSGVYRKAIWNKLGGMDERLFTPFYWEDIDLSYRAVKRGYKILWEPDSLVYHQHESTNKMFNNKYKLQIQERNELLFIWKNLTSNRLFQKHIGGILKRIVSGPGYIVVVLKALMYLPVVLKKRNIEKKQSKITDESIFAKFL